MKSSQPAGLFWKQVVTSFDYSLGEIVFGMEDGVTTLQTVASAADAAAAGVLISKWISG
jgi:hypothetical protein